MLTIFPESELYQQIQHEKWAEESELEKFAELKTLIENLNIHTEIMTEGASNLVRLHGNLPTDKQKLICYLEHLLHTADENTLRDYRTHLRHL